MQAKNISLADISPNEGKKDFQDETTWYKIENQSCKKLKNLRKDE